jgi:hypothetical protein
LSEYNNKLGFEKKTKPGKCDLKGPVGKPKSRIGNHIIQVIQAVNNNIVMGSLEFFQF